MQSDRIMAPAFLINGSAAGTLTPLDRGLAYGDGVFRTLPVQSRQPAHWALHYAKLHADCAALGLACPPAAQLLDDIAALCGADEAAVVKIIVTRGEGARGYATTTGQPVTRIVLKTALPDYPAHYAHFGVRLRLCGLRLSLQPRLAGIKHLNRLENVLARMEWNDADIYEGLLLDQQGRVVEGVMSNVFMRRGDMLLTPDLRRCGVAGVTRARILELAPQLGLQAEVADIALDQLRQADEVIICNSLYGAWQVRELDETSWPAGPLAGQLRARLA